MGKPLKVARAVGPRLVSAWKAVDGTLHDTEEAAIAHESEAAARVMQSALTEFKRLKRGDMDYRVPNTEAGRKAAILDTLNRMESALASMKAGEEEKVDAG